MLRCMGIVTFAVLCLSGKARRRRDGRRLQQLRRLQSHYLRSPRRSSSRCCVWPIRLIYNIVLYGRFTFTVLCHSGRARRRRDGKRLPQQRHLQSHYLRSPRRSSSRCCVWPIRLIYNIVLYGRFTFTVLCLSGRARKRRDGRRLQQRRSLPNHYLRSPRRSSSRCCVLPIRVIYNIVLYWYIYLHCSLSLRKSKEEKRREEAAAAEELAEPLPEVSKEKFFQVLSMAHNKA